MIFPLQVEMTEPAQKLIIWFAVTIRCRTVAGCLGGSPGRLYDSMGI